MPEFVGLSKGSIEEISLKVLFWLTVAFSSVAYRPQDPARSLCEFKCEATLSQISSSKNPREYLPSLFKNTLKVDREVMTDAEMAKLFDGLESFANSYGIQFTKTVDTVGVFPKGLFEIQLSGFSLEETSSRKANFLERHELGHLFHCVAVRAVLLESLKEKGLERDEESIRAAEATLGTLEGAGKNYRAFEKAVTGLSSPLHFLIPGETSKIKYEARLRSLLSDAIRAAETGKMTPRTEKTFVGLYALFISKAPILVGTSAKEFAVRIPFLLFSAMLVANTPVTSLGIPPSQLNLDEENKKWGLRDFLLALVSRLLE